MSPEGNRAGLLLRLQNALLGAVSPALYGGSVAVEGRLIILIWHVASNITDAEREELSTVGAQVIADFPSDFDIDERFVEVRDRSSPLTTSGEWFHLQRGFHTSENYGYRLFG